MNGGSRIEVRPLRTRADRAAFLALPARIYRDDPAWISPLLRDERRKLDPARHPFYDHGEAEFWIAWRDGDPVGRIGAQLNYLANFALPLLAAHFGMFEAIDDAAVFQALIGAAAGWARERRLARLEGPYNLSINEEFGILVDGFATPPCTLMAHTPPYYAHRLDELGFHKAKDFHEFEVSVAQMRRSSRGAALLGRTAPPEGCTLHLSQRLRAQRDFHAAIGVYNDAWRDNWGFVPVTPREVDVMVDQIRFIYDPRAVVIAMREGEAIGVAAALHDFNQAFCDLEGRLMPLGWAKAWARIAGRRIGTARVLLFGIRQRHRKSVLGARLYVALIRKLAEWAGPCGVDRLRIGWVLEDNTELLSLVELLGARRIKTYRVLSMAVG